MTGLEVGVAAAVVFGFIVVAKIVRRRRWMRHGGGGCGHHRGGCGHGRYGGYRMGRARFMRHMISRRLGLRAEQAETLDASMDQVRAAMDAARTEMKSRRGELADLIRGEALDNGHLDALLASQEATLHATRDSIVEAVRRLHAQLDPGQRAMLADWVSRGQGHHGEPA